MPQDRILLIEDDQDLLEDLPKVLRTYGLDAFATSDCKEAVRRVKEGSIDGVILDCKMPPSDDMSDEETDSGRLSGALVCKRLKQARPSVPILVVTSLSDPKAHTTIRNAGANDIIVKPVYPDEIVQRLKRLLREA
jgi:DNA-binding response OmpR family regulator